jgi:hypothetical protein
MRRSPRVADFKKRPPPGLAGRGFAFSGLWLGGSAAARLAHVRPCGADHASCTASTVMGIASSPNLGTPARRRWCIRLDIVGCSFGRPKSVPNGNVKPGQTRLIDGWDVCCRWLSGSWRSRHRRIGPSPTVVHFQAIRGNVIALKLHSMRVGAHQGHKILQWLFHWRPADLLKE